MNANYERIKEVAKDQKMNIKTLAEEVGVKRGVLDNISKGINGVSKSLAMSIVAVFPEYRLEWLLTGEGEKYKPTPSIQQVGEVTGNGNILQNGEHNEVKQESKALTQRIAVLEKALKDETETRARLEGENKILRETIDLLRSLLGK